MTMPECNKSGERPVEAKVLVRDDKPKEKVGQLNIIYAPDEAQRKEEVESVVATIVDAGGNAFGDWEGLVPKPGDRVRLAKYAGQPFTGEDGNRYRVCHDIDVAGIVYREDAREVLPTNQPDGGGDGAYEHLRSK